MSTRDLSPDDVRRICVEYGWLAEIGSVRFLAAGEYNENYRVDADGHAYVFRVNRGTQIGAKDQIAYEFGALKAVERSNRTPKPYRYASATDRHPGILLEAYIDGDSFEYARDTKLVANTLARIHSLPVRAARSLVRQDDMIQSLLSESSVLINKYRDHPHIAARRLLEQHAQRIRESSAAWTRLLAGEPRCIVNSELNSGNLIVCGPHLMVVDWEKAVISLRYQDLSHFLAPTTTLWKSDYRFSPEARDSFLAAYLDGVEFQITLEELSHRTAIMESVILLRALSWCYAAYYEYTQSDRALTNAATFERITSYLDEMAWLLH